MADPRCAGSLREKQSLVVLYQREDIVTVELLASVQEYQFHDKTESGHCPSTLFHELGGGAGRASRRQKIVHNQHAMPVGDGASVNLESVGPILERVGNADPLTGQFLRLSHRDETRAQGIGEGGREDKATRLDPD